MYIFLFAAIMAAKGLCADSSNVGMPHKSG